MGDSNRRGIIRGDQPQVQYPRGLGNPFQSYELQVIGVDHTFSEAILLPHGFWNRTFHFLSWWKKKRRKHDGLGHRSVIKKIRTYFGEPLDAFCQFCREFGPVDVPGWVTVVQRADLVVLNCLFQFLRLAASRRNWIYQPDASIFHKPSTALQITIYV